MNKVLKLIFTNSKGKTSVITLHNPKSVDADTAKAAMQKVIDANIFDNSGIIKNQKKEVVALTGLVQVDRVYRVSLMRSLAEVV